MRAIPIVFLSYLVLVGTIVLYMAIPTDADLLDKETVADNTFTALTLDLQNLDTANQSQKTLLFSIQGLVPGGFAVESIRLKNTGSQTLSYQLSFQQTSGQTEACNALQARILRNWSVIQTTNLPSVGLSGDLAFNEVNDVVFGIELGVNEASLQNQSCLFNVVVSAKAKDVTGEVLFSDEEVLQNQIIFGTWSSQ